MSNKSITVTILMIIAVTIAVYWQSLGYGYLYWDDDLQIIDNPLVQSISWNHVLKSFQTFAVGMYTPLGTISYMLEYNLAGQELWLIRLVSLAFHLTNVMLVYWLLRLLKLKRFLALLAVTIFALHPMNTEAIVWLSARSTLSSSCFSLLSIITYLYYQRRGQKYYYILALIFFITALLSKSTAMVIPVIILIIDWLEGKSLKAVIVDKIPWLSLSVVAGILTIKGRQILELSFNQYLAFNLIDRLLIFNHSFWLYVYKFVAPINLSPFYELPTKTGTWLPWSYYASLTLSLASLALIYKYQKKLMTKKIYLLATAWLIINLAPVLKHMTYGKQIIADRYNYLAMLGLIILIVQLIDTSITETKWRKLLIIINVAYLSMLATLSWQQTKIWSDNTAFYQYAIEQAPHSIELYFNEAVVRYRQADYQGAEIDTLVALELEPHNPEVLHLLGLIKETQQDYELAEFLYNRSWQIKPNIEVLFKRAMLRLKTKQLEAAINDFDQCIEAGYGALAYLHRGLAQLQLSHVQEACADFKVASQLGNQQALALLKLNCASQ